MLDLVKLCLAPCCSCLQSSVVREDMSYVFCTKDKLDSLETVMKGLMAKKQDIESKLDLPENRGKQPTHQLQHWVDQVGEKDKQVKKLLDEYRQGCCVRGPCCLNCVSRYSISKNAINLLAEITQLKGEQSEVSFIQQQPPKPVPESYKIVGEKISSNVDLSRSYLADETVSMIGIWGMGGVGKSTLLKKIKQSLSGDANMGFDHVLFIEASKDIQSEKLRKKIAESLRLEPSAGKEDIFNVLKISNFVLLLDNIWEEVDLIDLGIRNSYSDDNSTEQYKHKVIFTTRSEDVCARMGAGEMIKVECLEPDEAWGLFKDNLNNPDVIETDGKFKKIAWQVMKKCDGLPLALKVVGKAMSNKRTVQEWDYILTSLMNSSTKVVQGMEESLFPILKVSYDNLRPKIEKCFLTAALRVWISKYDLFECWMGLGLIGDFVSLREAYNEAEYILKILEESSLLYISGCVGLHDVIYEMAMWIASDYGENRNKWIVKQYDGFAEISTEEAENWRSANRVVIYGIKLLPVLSHQCSNLLCLMIENSFSLEKIPKGFLGQMPNLIYLDLSHARIKDLPKDIKCLVNLQYLNISYTKISSLPKELVYLKKLEYLICRYLAGLGQVKKGLISRLQKLKVIDLYPYGSVQPEELKILGKHIKAIGMRVVSEEVLQQLSCLPTTQLCIKRLDSVTSLSFDILSCKNHGFLQQLSIHLCQQLEQIVMNGSETHLNTLEIIGVKKLQNIIWRDIRPPEFFHMLNRLHISFCNLDNLAWVVHLPCLSHMGIQYCAKIETLFYIKEETEIQQVSERPTFPALQILILGDLPNLVSISNSTLDFPQLSWLSVTQCVNVKKLPFKRGINRSQKINITCEREWWERLEWDDDAASPSQLSPHDIPLTFMPDDCEEERWESLEWDDDAASLSQFSPQNNSFSCLHARRYARLMGFAINFPSQI